ncbi:protease [Arthrobacter phage Colucci]|uniref:Protease n=1 Tax=Arthrobacter phage Colucci TaxID=2015834 RepID=A0A286N325_9CAUD|nr:amidase [Arthrobacter phage Colucci]ASX98782.1 protease [Arthrobacter phage Colucci]
MGKITDFFRKIWQGNSMGHVPGQVSSQDAEDAMAAAARLVQPSELTRRMDYEAAVRSFIPAWEGRDAPSEAYGPQSPALIQEFMRWATDNDEWTWPAFNAADLADHPDALAPYFFRLPATASVRYGDIVVQGRDELHPFGNVGIAARAFVVNGYVDLFTQTYTNGCQIVTEPANITAVFRKSHAA